MLPSFSARSCKCCITSARAPPIKSRRLGEATLQNHRKLDHRPE